MHLSKRISLLLTVFIFALFNLNAQTVTGKISDEKGESLPGVSVLVKGTTNGVITDLDGKYSLIVDKNATLVYSYVGFLTKEEVLGGRSSVNVTLAVDTKALGEVVVVGYGTQRKVTVTGAVATLQGEKIIKSPATDISNSLAGRLPGLVVIQQRRLRRGLWCQRQA